MRARRLNRLASPPRASPAGISRAGWGLGGPAPPNCGPSSTSPPARTGDGLGGPSCAAARPCRGCGRTLTRPASSPRTGTRSARTFASSTTSPWPITPAIPTTCGTAPWHRAPSPPWCWTANPSTGSRRHLSSRRSTLSPTPMALCGRGCMGPSRPRPTSSARVYSPSYSPAPPTMSILSWTTSRSRASPTYPPPWGLSTALAQSSTATSRRGT
mmetsp:Transcript_10613/g.31340  ORF Transcript_10613/g.31340 Transcript_10613/m.31340 type:complete len:214 (+) Transcript_10613:7312-7953(+)